MLMEMEDMHRLCFLLQACLFVAAQVGAAVQSRSGRTPRPLIYACHFYRQHGKGVQLCAQLLFRKADPHYRVKDGDLA